MYFLPISTWLAVDGNVPKLIHFQNISSKECIIKYRLKKKTTKSDLLFSCISLEISHLLESIKYLERKFIIRSFRKYLFIHFDEIVLHRVE